MSRFRSDLYDQVFPRPVKSKTVESAVVDFKETETEVVEHEEVETEVETEVIDEVETVEQEVE